MGELSPNLEDRLPLLVHASQHMIKQSVRLYYHSPGLLSFLTNKLHRFLACPCRVFQSVVSPMTMMTGTLLSLVALALADGRHGSIILTAIRDAMNWLYPLCWEENSMFRMPP